MTAKQRLVLPLSELLLAIGLTSGCHVAAADRVPDTGTDASPPQGTPEAGTLPNADPNPLGAYAFPCSGQGELSRAATFEAVYIDVFCHAGCTNSYCHGSQGAWQGLDLSTIGAAYQGLVGQKTGQLIAVDQRPTCRNSQLLRVEAGAPERSLLYLKLSGMPPCGTAMPPPSEGLQAISREDLDQVRRWILARAQLTADAGL